MDKYVRDGKVAVLISKGYGAGWSTWLREDRYLFDPVIVGILLDDSIDKQTQYDDILTYCHKIEPYGFFAGVDGLCVEWVAEGTAFRVTEYDGHETLERMSETNWKVA